ncbi:MAG: phospholipase D family protein [Proteobacteria bacterium]|nr:phospholipase D family protein [Pseudomonadota bacterium]
MKFRSTTMIAMPALAVLVLLLAQPALARPKSVGGMIDSAVTEFVQSRDSVTLPATGTVEVAFSPKGGCTAATVRFVEEARQSIRIAAYGLTSNPIGKALVEAKKRGVDVRVVADREHNGRRDKPNSVVNFLAASGIPVRIDSAVRIQHNKVVIVDGQSVQNGSFNFTAAAQTSNAENIIIHRGFPELARTFTDNWNHLWNESTDYQPTY